MLLANAKYSSKLIFWRSKKIKQSLIHTIELHVFQLLV